MDRKLRTEQSLDVSLYTSVDETVRVRYIQYLMSVEPIVLDSLIDEVDMVVADLLTVRVVHLMIDLVGS